MEAVRQLIIRRKARLAEHPFFDGLERCASPRSVVALAPALTFWGRALRDVLQAGAERREAVGAPTSEDEERRYLEDVERLVGSRLPAALVAGDAHPLTRDASYKLLYEVLASKTDGLRLVLLTSVDAMRELFFHRIAPLAASLDDVERFRSFEQYRDELRTDLDDVSLGPDDEEEAVALVERVFAVFDRMFDGLTAMRG